MDDFERQIERIITDNRSGSKAIVNQIVDTLLSFQEWDHPSAIDQVKGSLLKVLDKHINLVVIYHFINLLFLEIEKSGDHKSIRQFINYYKDSWKNASSVACQYLLNDLNLTGKSILLHSNSSSIRELFELVPHNQNLPQIFQTVSGPVNEGQEQAETLVGMGFPVELIHENAIENFIRKIDMAIFGADLITEHFFVNKAGTFPLILAFKYFNKPVYLLADSRKIINILQLPGKLKYKLTIKKEKPANELWDNNPEQVKVSNLYFDKIPVEFLSKIYCEKGIFPPDKMAILHEETEIANEILDVFR
jgi:translation initiation factor 2B subunit (eIF-2B alpha/beta/delta family)